MSIWTTLYTGSSGITAFGEGISVVGDNIANISTTGFKGSRANFEALLGGTAGNGQREGAGVKMDGPETLFEQGSLTNTGRSMDLAIRGNGFFSVKGPHEGIEGSFFTRDGRFNLDGDGYIVTSEGLRLQGYSIDATGAQSPVIGDLNIPRQATGAATSTADVALNLDAREPPMVWDPANPAGSSNKATSMTIYDSLGTARRVDVYFAKTSDNQWEWHAMVDGGDVGQTAGTPVEVGSGALGFTNTGALDSQSGSFTADFVGAEPGQTIAFNFGDAIQDGGTGRSGTQQQAGPFSTTQVNQNGFGAGSLLDMHFSDQGVVSAVYSNGQERPVGNIAIAMFGREDKLERSGNQLFSRTVESGDPLVDAAGHGSRGSIAAMTLESSNVDLSKELVTLIAYQRAFQSNAKTVTTADEMLTEVANLKR
ncbi:MAG: flagellar hook protein FlgE [Myxococcota bacterium]